MENTILILSLLMISNATLASRQDVIAKEIQRIELSADIGQMVGEDQAFRFGGAVLQKKGIRWDEISRHPLYQRRLAKVDSENGVKMKAIVKKHGWPKISDFGEYTARNAWLLVQHMDTDVVFQEQVLLQMTSLLKSQEVLKDNYAYLYDRVQVNRGRLQLYGTQGGCVGHQWEPKPIENPADVDKRRAEFGLPTLEEYRKMFKDGCL